MEDMIKGVQEAALVDDIQYHIIESKIIDESHLRLRVEVVYQYTTNVIQLWEIDCLNFEDHRISLYFYDYMKLSKEHPLLLQYAEQSYELYATGNAFNNNSLLGQLFIAHNDIYKEWVPFGLHNNARTKNSNIDGYGLLCKGPETIINEYERILHQNKIKTSKLRTSVQCQWNGYQYLPTFEYQVLNFEETYVIAKNFITRRII